jgi:hypothetical protein
MTKDVRQVTVCYMFNRVMQDRKAVGGFMRVTTYKKSGVEESKE